MRTTALARGGIGGRARRGRSLDTEEQPAAASKAAAQPKPKNLLTRIVFKRAHCIKLLSRHGPIAYNVTMPAKVLIVDDEALVVEVLARQFRFWGYEAYSAASAEEALTLLERERVDIVLLDNVMPGMTGLKALTEIRRRSAAPVLMMTGHHDPEFAEDARLLGAAGTMAKPLAAPALQAALKKLLAAGD